MAGEFFLGAAANYALGTLTVDYVVKPILRSMRHREELPSLEFMTSNDVVASKSSTVAINEIMDALKDEEVKMMGVWGMGGVGKTTLVTQVGNLVKRLRLFSKVIIVVVSQTQSIENIQNKIADFLHLKFEKTTLKGKAEELWLRLEKEEKVLIVLDDMWNELNLKDIGIPLAEKGKEKGCKIILTTRNKRVCESMECQVTVRVDVLGGEEAWDLFKMKANLDETRVSKSIIKEAKKVAEECKGLPVAIVTLASALKRAESKEDWESARELLERSRLIEIGNIEEKDKNVYSCIRTSYDCLKSEATKRCFLLCSLYPEDHLIDIEILVRFALSLRLYGEAYSVKQCRSRVLEAIGYLKDSSLVIEGDGDVRRYIKLHDIVRDVALWIASKEENNFLIKSRLELLNVSSGPCNAISLLNSEEKKLTERLVHTKLEIMLLKNCDVRGTCFQGMGELKVLSLSAIYGSSGIISLYALTSLQKLRTLILENFEDFSFLGNLRTLEILILRDSEIMKGLEDELGRLENLKILELTECIFATTFQPNVIRRMSKLEELYLKDSTNIGDSEEINHIIAEINSLSRLKALSLEIDSCHFRDDFEFLKLERYDISIRAENGPYFADLTEKSWKIWGAIPLKVFSLLPENLESLDVSDYPSLRSLFPLSIAQSLVLLKTLKISSCHGLKQIVIELEGDEEEISSTINSHNSLCFPKLQTLKVENCDGLEYIFPTLMSPQGIQGLNFTIKNCHQLKQVIKIPEDNRVGNDLLLQQLQSLRSLMEISISNCPQLTDSIVHLEAQKALLKDVRLSAFEESFSTSKNLILVYCNDVECLADTTTNNGPTSAFTHLERLFMRKMKGLESLCKGQPPQGFLEDLKELDVNDCKKLQVLFQMDEHREEKQDQPLSNLQSLKLKKLPELRWILKGSAHSFTLPSLKVVNIKWCDKLESLFSPSLIQSLVLLEELYIESCPELKTLFEELENDDEVESKTSSSCSSRPLSLPKLKTLRIRGCSKLKQVLSMAKEEDGVEHDLHLPSLQHVYLRELKSLTSFVPDNYTVKAPSLKTLTIEKCPKVMKVSIQQELNKQLKLELKLEGTGLSVFKELSCNTKDVILMLVDDHRKNMVPDVVDLEHLDGLTSLCIEGWKKCKCLVDTSQAMTGFTYYKGQPFMPKAFLQNLKKLIINGCTDMLEIFRDDNSEENQAPPMILSNLKHLELWRLSELRWIVKGPTHCVNLQGLKLLQISDCYRLEYLFSVSLIHTLRLLEELRINHCHDLKSVFTKLESNDGIESNTLCSLPNLKTVEIISCPSLEYLFSVSLSHTLRSLEKLEINNCHDLKNVFTELESNDGIESNTRCSLPNLKTVEICLCPTLEYVFSLSLARGLPRLQKVYLGYLRSLSSIVAGNNFLEAPALEILNIEDCPAFQRHVNYCSTLKELKFSMRKRDGEEQTSPDFECLTLGNFGQLFQLQDGNLISSLEKMVLRNSSWLRNIWKGPTRVATNLRELEVRDCNKLTYIFPMMLIPHLPQLSILRIEFCQNLKQIIANDDISASSSSQGPQLEKKMVFPQLKEIVLENLSRLESFSPVGYHLEFPCLKLLAVRKYFKMVTSFTVDYLTLTVHAQTNQASQLDDVSPSRKVIFWTRRRPTFLPHKKMYVKDAEEISRPK